MKVTFGEIDGNQWEEYCQKLFRIKYNENDYQEIPARFAGDLGLEGFTRTGEAFQCYCPNDNPPAKELYESQRKKITDDIKKLIKNEYELKKILGNTKIRRWYLVTPGYEDKALLEHCQKKAKEVRDSGCSHIEDDFDVLIQTENDYILEGRILNSQGLLEVDVSPEIVSKDEIMKWISNENTLYKNIHEKLSKIPNVKDVNKLTELNIKTYLQGQNIISKLHKDYPLLYEKLMKYKDAQEIQIENFSIMGCDNPSEFLKECIQDYEVLIKEGLGSGISPAMIKRISGEAIADWLIRCPLDF